MLAEMHKLGWMGAGQHARPRCVALTALMLSLLLAGDAQVVLNPLPDVVARPIEEDLFVWHGNGEEAAAYPNIHEHHTMTWHDLHLPLSRCCQPNIATLYLDIEAFSWLHPSWHATASGAM